jgi:hypothetical protein
MNKIAQIETKIDYLERKLAIVEETFKKSLWINEHPPKFKYGDTWDGIKILSCNCESLYTTDNFFSTYHWVYHVDSGTDYQRVSEETLIETNNKQI